ncbi:hypothetical protein SAY87_001978 [Trapa incisa]|uniref:Uncharacterized protein n=1 Tax=Trapa incisa TaxID=236973 RepID=A0AAN7PU59_9MYRT|nr:hypothetical protein SAY87_001978 [Trapa incisa]
MGDHFYPQAQEDVDGSDQEALSLSDFPLHDNTSIGDHSNRTPPMSSSHSPDFFEFFSEDFRLLDGGMCAADDIIICGKLVPFKDPKYPAPNFPATGDSHAFAREKLEVEEEKEEISIRHSHKATLRLRSRSESSSRSNHSQRPKISELTRNSRSLDYRKPQRFPDPSGSSPPETVNAIHSAAKYKGIRKSTSDVTSSKRAAATRPRWSLFAFGMAKLPAEMELEDIKTRQLRRNPTAKLFVPVERSGDRLPVGRSNNKRSSWKLLSALSCKGNTSVAVMSTSSLACLPQGESFA